MNCKQGDLAMVIKGISSGTICTCERLMSYEEAARYGYSTDLDGPMWFTDKMFLSTWGDSDPLMFDDYLMPIRDPGPEAVDETLEWLKVPTTEGQPA